ncbi:MAG: hypothetical protein ABI794_15710 [Betaproteobacteria bacterium]
MKSIVIKKRFCGPPNSANGGYVCGLLAAHIQGSAEITLLAPPPLDRRLDLVVAEHGAALKQGETTLATGRPARIDVPEIPIVGFSLALEAVRQSPYDERSHPLPTCFVCGPARSDGDGLRIIPRPLPPCPGYSTGTVATPWVPYANLTSEDGAIAGEYIWAALDCPTGFAAVGARHLGMTGTEAVLLGRMGARIERRPHPEEHCVIVAWPTGKDRRKLFANSALLSSSGELLAVAQATWLLVNRQDAKLSADASGTGHPPCD